MELVNTLVALEIRNTPRVNVIFRGNTVSTKIVDSFMKITGKKD